MLFGDDFAVDDLEAAVELFAGSCPAVVAPEPDGRFATDAGL